MIDRDRVPSDRCYRPEGQRNGVSISHVDKPRAPRTGVSVPAPNEAPGIHDGWIEGQFLSDVYVPQRPIVVTGPNQIGEFGRRIGVVILGSRSRVYLGVQQGDLGELAVRSRHES